jgi:hypothetical protein
MAFHFIPPSASGQASALPTAPFSRQAPGFVEFTPASGQIFGFTGQKGVMALKVKWRCFFSQFAFVISGVAGTGPAP